MISVLVVGRSSYEDKISLCMVARAFGASNITFYPSDSGVKGKLARKCRALNRDWGGTFGFAFTDDWKGYVSEKKNYLKVYLTRYGLPIGKIGYRVRTYKNVLLIVSENESTKQLYKAADFNISITTQPHSCASSVAVFLHDFYQGRELAMHFENAMYKINPEQHGMRVEMERSH